MKKLFILLVTLVVLNVSAQDVIVKLNGDELQCKVLEVNKNEVKYKRWSNLDGPTFVEEKSDVFMIKYQNGEKDVFEVKSTHQFGDASANNFLLKPAMGMTVPNLKFEKKFKSGLSSDGTELSMYQAQMVMGKDWEDFQNFQKKRKKGKNLIVWSAVCRFLSTGTFIIGFATWDEPWWVVAAGFRAASYPLLGVGLSDIVKGYRGCKRLVKQHDASSLGFNPEFDLGLGVNAVSFRMNF